MKSLITSMLVGVFLFIGSAGLSWWLIYTPPEETEEVAETDGEGNDFPIEVADSEKQEEMPVGLRPDMKVTYETVADMAQSIMKKEQKLFQEEQKLKKDEQRINLLFEDLRREQEELKAFSDRIDKMILEAKEAVKLLQMEKQDVSTKLDELSVLEKKVGVKADDVESVEMANRVSKIKGLFSEMEPQGAAKMLADQADKDLTLVAELLASIEDRKAGQILDAMMNQPGKETLVAQLLEEYANASSRDKRLRR